MKKTVILLIVALVCSNVISGEMGLPIERFAFPPVTGSHLICIWDESAETWLHDWVAYDESGSYDFQVPAWNKWYWVGLWDEVNGEYVYGKWIGHFLTD